MALDSMAGYGMQAMNWAIGEARPELAITIEHNGASDEAAASVLSMPSRCKAVDGGR